MHSAAASPQSSRDIRFLIKSTRQAGIATCCLIFIATFSLEYLFFTDNFSTAYVVAHSNRALATFYKVAALWSGQEGSLLFWSFLLSIYVFSVSDRLPRTKTAS